jgi:hypothetical protein
MRKGPGSAYDKWNISMVVCDTDIHSGQPSHAGDRKAFEVTTSTKPRGTLGSVASLLAAALYQGNPDRNHTLWNIVSTERYPVYTPPAGAAGMLLHINGKFTMGKLKSSLFP